MGLLGMLAAGAATGAMNASNLNVQAQNEIEMENMREELRQKFYLQGRADTRADAKELSEAKALLNEANYQRDRGDKLVDTEMTHAQQLRLEDRKDKRTEMNNSARLAVAERSGSGGSAKEKDGVMLPNGEMFYGNDGPSKMIVNLIKSGTIPPDVPAAYKFLASKGYTSAAAGSLSGMTQGTVKTSKQMAEELFGSEGKARNERVYNPKTGKFE